ncbi:MAG TPA: hypothetical protein VMG41_06350 [Gemmatimonadales bacterium]|nr:hypothetical protein [Gemmatimonadales bacterium]
MRRLSILIAILALPALPARAEVPGLAVRLAGPPWISIELPANPFVPGARDAFCLVRVYHHGDAAYYPVQGTAEGLVAGTRRHLKIDLTDTGVPGLYAAHFQPDSAGTWMLVFRVGTEENHGSATAIVTLDRQGRIVSVQVPSHPVRGYLIPDAVSAERIDQMLRDAARS